MTKKLKEMSTLQKRLFMLLPMGSSELITTVELESILKIDKRTVRGIIEDLVAEYGIPVGSMRHARHNGYYIATNHEEKLQGTAAIAEQAKTMQRRVERIEMADLNIAYKYKDKYTERTNEQVEQLGLHLTLTDGKTKHGYSEQKAK